MNFPLLQNEYGCICYYAVLILVAIVFFMCQTVNICRHNNHQTANIPPGSEGFPFIGETLHFMAAIHSGKGFYEFVRTRRLRYGNCFRSSIFGETQVFVSSTEASKTILINDLGRFTKRYIKSIGQLVGEQSLLCAPYHHHKLIRGRLIGLFSTASISLFVQHFDEILVESIRDWERKDCVIVLNEVLQITLKAMCKILMSMEKGQELERLQEDIALVYQAMLAFPLRLPWSRFSKGLQARKRFMHRLNKEIRSRREGNKSHCEDFLQHLLADVKEKSNDNSKLSDTEIQDNILTMIIAGQDTTASAITWMVKYLDENPNVQEKVRAEQFQFVRNTSRHRLLRVEDMNEMPFARKVVKESLRMASIVPWFPRQALQDCEVEGYKIKRGWTVNVNARSIHFDPDVYNDPETFNPSRFDEEPKPGSFLPFGTGGRTCLGMNMAKAMMLVFLHRLVTTYKWKVIDSDSRVEKWSLFSRLQSGCPINVTPVTEDFAHIITGCL